MNRALEMPIIDSAEPSFMTVLAGSESYGKP
jgi:hypothetical protein